MAGDTSYRAVLEKLTACNTVSSESNLDLIGYAEAFLSGCGFRTERRLNGDGRKANLVARLGPNVAGGIALSGHTDVVPVSGQQWTADPFRLVEKAGCLYGRGTADMKGFIALAMEAASLLNGHELAKPVYLMLTYDEETGCQGAMDLREYLDTMPAKPSFVLIGEPTGLQLVTAHKGIQQMTTRVRGKPAHSSRPDLGASAIEYAGRFVSGLPGALPKECDDAFDPPVTTSNVGRLRGGEAVNIIPQYCELQWEFRHLPSQQPEDIHASLERLADDVRAKMPGISVQTKVNAAVPAMLAGENRQIVEQLECYFEPPRPRRSTAPFVTEGGLYQQAGIPAVVCGPGLLEQAHQPDEYVSIQAMEIYRGFLSRLLADALTK